MTEDRKPQGRDATEQEPVSTRDEGGFLSRWSRRKREAAIAPERAENVDVRTDEHEDVKAPTKDAVEPPNETTDADMPPIDSLDENSDYSPFLSPKVSQKLRSVALRKLFHTAGFNIRDGLDDYDDDFTVFEPLGDTITADMRHHMEREKEKERQRLAQLADDESGEESKEPFDDDREQIELASVDDDVNEDEVESREVEPDEDDGNTPRA